MLMLRLVNVELRLMDSVFLNSFTLYKHLVVPTDPYFTGILRTSELTELWELKNKIK